MVGFDHLTATPLECFISKNKAMLYLSKKDKDGVIQEVYEVVGNTSEFYVIKLIWSANEPIGADAGVVEVVQKSIPHVVARYEEHQTLPCED